MTEEQKNEVAVWQPPSFEGTDMLPTELVGGDHDLTGRENIDAEDMILPQFKLLQGMSEECNDRDNYPDARPGLFLHTGTGEVYEPPVRGLLVFHNVSRALFPKERDPRSVDLQRCLSRDGVTGSVYGDCESCEHKEWDNDRNLPPLCSKANNFTMLTPFGPAMLRMERTSFKASRKFLTTWMMSPKPLWAHPVKIVTKAEQKNVDGKNVTFFRMEVRWLTREDVPSSAQSAARAVHERISAAHEQGRFGSDADGQESDVEL